ncbi:lipopolysaccharide biosynthesis protein [Agromyces sp. MMS24-JH15]|uniref:lipopolysaccharide biosynthesis protein n=1 Tax=Agromyces sp. MMS24-JH15 TaxID=3243765 RepID=UPI00374A5CD2
MAGLFVVGARGLGPATFGVVVAHFAAGTAAAGFFDFGGNSLWVRDLANGQRSTTEIRDRAVSKLMLGTAMAGGWLLVVSRLDPLAWIAPSTFLAVLSYQTSGVWLRGAARAVPVAIAALVERFTAAIGIGIAAAIGQLNEVEFVIALNAGTLIAAGLLALLTPDRWSSRFRLRNPWSGALFYGLFSAASAIQRLDVNVLNLASGATAAGVYGAVNRWTQPIGLFANAFSTASAPFVAGAATEAEAWAIVRRGLWLPMLGVLIAVGFAVAAPLLVPFLLGESYIGAVGVLQILALATIPGIANQILATFLQSRGADKPVAIVVLTSSLVSIGVVIVFAPDLGALAAAMGVVVLHLAGLAGMAAVAAVLRRERRGK